MDAVNGDIEVVALWQAAAQRLSMIERLRLERPSTRAASRACCCAVLGLVHTRVAPVVEGFLAERWR